MGAPTGASPTASRSLLPQGAHGEEYCLRTVSRTLNTTGSGGLDLLPCSRMEFGQACKRPSSKFSWGNAASSLPLATPQTSSSKGTCGGRLARIYSFLRR